jgi:serine phosphatase RsbU (regulator of sigma subunit)
VSALQDDADAQALAEQIVDAVLAFQAGNASDDIVVVVLRAPAGQHHQD